MLDIKFKPFPNLATDRLFLRAITMDDKNNIYNLRSDPKVMEYVCRPLASSIEEAESFINKIIKGIKDNQLVYWGITTKVDNSLIGTICLWNVSRENHRAEIGYELMPAFQGQGLMQEAIIRVIEYAFNKLRLHSLEAEVNPANIKSLRLLERNGFSREAYFRENVYYNGRYFDTVIYTLFNHS